MPLIAINKFTKSDVVNNEKCFFIYAENEKKEGGNEFLRSCHNTLYLTIKAVASNDQEAYWSDVDYRQHVEVLSEDVGRIQNILNLGGVVFIESTFLQEEKNGPMKSKAPKTLKFITKSIDHLLRSYQPKYISPNLTSPRTPYATQN
jgi:hypothetical protein